MKQEDKNLLLKDLCARLPYGVWIEQKLKSCKFGSKCMLHAYDIDGIERGHYDFCKPCLFPLSSMTEEQRKEFLNIQSEERKILTDALVKYRYEKEDNIPIIPFQKHIDWLNKNHFDYRGLIEKGLAIDATGLNIY